MLTLGNMAFFFAETLSRNVKGNADKSPMAPDRSDVAGGVGSEREGGVRPLRIRMKKVGRKGEKLSSSVADPMEEAPTGLLKRSRTQEDPNLASVSTVRKASSIPLTP